MAAWWLSRPEGYPVQKGWYRGSKVDGLVRLLTIVFMYTIGLPITAVLWILYIRRFNRDRRAGKPPQK